jgi:hypothetical protein
MNHTPSQLAHDIRMLTKVFKANLATAQKAFAKNPSATNWQNTHLAMFDYQQWMVVVTWPDHAHYVSQRLELVTQLRFGGHARDTWGGIVCHFADADRRLAA